MTTARKVYMLFFFIKKNNAHLLIGDILEIGAYYSVRVKDIASFERYIAQLNTYYHDLS